MNDNRRQRKQVERAIAKKDDSCGEVLVPMRAQPQYPVPDDVVALRNEQTADWSLDRDIEVLRLHIALETKKTGGGNAALVAQLAKAVESLIRTNVSTALRTGEWLSRSTVRQILRGTADDVAELIREHVPDDDVYSDLIQQLKARLLQRISREAVAAANQRNEQL